MLQFGTRTFSRMAKRKAEEVDLSWCDDIDSQYNGPWDIRPHSLDVLNNRPLSVRFTPPVSFACGTPEVEDAAWLKYIDKHAHFVCKEGSLDKANYDSDTKTDKRMHYHAIVVSNKDAFRVMMNRIGCKGVFADYIEDNPRRPNWSLVKAFRYMCKDTPPIILVNKLGVPVERIHDDFHRIEAEVAAYKSAPKAKKIKSGQSWFDLVQSKVSKESMSNADIGAQILKIYRQHGKQIPAAHSMATMIGTIVYDNNANQQVPLSEQDLFRRLYPNLA